MSNKNFQADLYQPTDGTLTSIITSGQSEPTSNGNERVLYTPEWETRHQMQFSVMPRTPLLGRVFPPSAKGTINVF